LRERRIGVSEVIVSDLDVDAALLDDLIHGPASPDEGSASMAEVWGQLKRFARVRIDDARVGLAPIGVPGAVTIEHLALTRHKRGKYFQAEAVIRQQLPGQDAGFLAARCDLMLEGDTLAIRNAHAPMKHMAAPAAYFAFFAPKLTEAPILRIDELGADAHVLIGPKAETLVVAIERIDLKSPVATAKGAFTIDAGKDDTKYDVHVAVARGTQRVLEFLPRELLGESTSAWLAANLKEATVTDGQLDLAGDSKDVESLVLRLPAKDVTLTFAPGWPAVAGADALVIIGPDSLHVDGGPPKQERLALSDFKVDIASFAKPVVRVEAAATAEANGVLASLARTPLKPTIALIQRQPLAIAGPVGAKVLVEADIGAAEPKVDVHGTADLQGVNVKMNDERIPP
jgi:hypothetical protein